MKDFNTKNIRKYKISLFGCQVDLVLRSLELYSYTYRFVAPQKKPQTREEDARISLVRDTYEQILAEYAESKKEQQKYKEII